MRSSQVYQRIYDDADIVQQAGQIGFLWLRISNAIGEFPADHSAAEREWRQKMSKSTTHFSAGTSLPMQLLSRSSRH
jgi:hypothetical protein